MSVEQQYIDLYNKNRDVIFQHSAGALNDLRDEAFRRFAEGKFPTTEDEDYQHTDMSKLFMPDYGMNVAAVEFPINPYEIFRCGVPGINSHLFFVINDLFYNKPQSNAEALPNGVIACSLKKAAVEHKDLVDKYYGKALPKKHDEVVDFNTAFAEDGFFFYVPKGVAIDQTIQLVNIMRADIDMMANSHNLIIIDDEASAKLLVCAHTIDDKKFLANRVTEVFVGNNAHYEHYKLESTKADMTNIGSLFVHQAADSDVLINEVTLQNGLTRNNVVVDFEGENANLNLCGMAITDGNQQVDTNTLVNHNVGHCTTNELYKYVLQGKAVGNFSGKIMVAPDAQKTKAIQTNKNICLDHEARMYAKPHLEIYADDVICNHGATVGQLDENEIFYLRSRGIPEAEAKMLLMFAFVSDVEEQIRVPALRDTIKMMIERRLRGQADSACTGCSSKTSCKA